MKKIVACKPLESYRVWLRFDDGIEGIADLNHLVGKGVFRAWDDPAFFQTAHVDEWGALAWNEQIDLCPDSLYLKVTGLQPEELFPALRNHPAHA